MSGLMDKAKEKLGQKENNFGQPGDKVEGQADNSVNSSKLRPRGAARR